MVFVITSSACFAKTSAYIRTRIITVMWQDLLCCHTTVVRMSYSTYARIIFFSVDVLILCTREWLPARNRGAWIHIHVSIHRINVCSCFQKIEQNAFGIRSFFAFDPPPPQSVYFTVSARLRIYHATQH